MDAASFRSSFEAITRKYLDQTILLSEYRHFAIAIGRVYVRELMTIVDKVENRVEEDAVEDLQAAHSSLTADLRYGVRSDIISRFSQVTFQQFYLSTKKWHAFMFPTMANKKRAHSDILSPRASSLEMVRSPTSAVTPPLTPTVISTPTSSQQIAIVYKKARFGDSNDEDTDSLTRYTFPVEVTTTLKTMYGPTATFKSHEQSKALLAVLSGDHPLLIVMPTGEFLGIAIYQI